MESGLNKKVLLAIAIASLSGCGGGGSGSGGTDSGGNEPTPDPLPTPVEREEQSEQAPTFSGKAADGYLASALVCLDLNANLKCDSDEPNAITDDQGNFTLEATEEQKAAHSVVVKAIAGQTIDLDNPDETIDKPFTLTAPPGQEFISPLSTLVAKALKDNPELTPEQAADKVRRAFGLPEGTDVTQDYIANADDITHQLAQRINATIANALANASEDSSSDSVEENIDDLLNYILDAVNENADEIAAATSPEDVPDIDPINDDVSLEDITTDSDNDGVNNASDAFPEDPSETQDTDNDGTGDNTDTDDDGDGYLDTDEITAGSDPLNADDIPSDNDGDGISDVSDTDDDNDGVSDEEDAFPFDYSESMDNDNDGIGDNEDNDDDNDSFSDTDEITAGSDPLNASSTPEVDDGIDNDNDEQIDEGFDQDGDGYTPIFGQDCDDTDSDRNPGAVELFDGIDNNCNMQIDEGFIDTDGDGQHDGVDTDDDNDGIDDESDAYPLDPSESADSDNDGLGDNADTDDDNDTVSDTDEIAAGSDPLDPESTPEIDDGIDNDKDGDTDEGFDIDGDGFTPIYGEDCDDTNATVSPTATEIFDGLDNDCDGVTDEGFIDSDGDGQHDDVDLDDDNDGVIDDNDAFPLDPLETTDTDNDGEGNNADADDDNDGYDDSVEVAEGSDPLNSDSIPNDMDGDYIPDSTDSDIDGDGYSNDQEIAAGTDPYDVTDQPLDMLAELELGTYYYSAKTETEEDGTEYASFVRYPWIADGNGNSAFYEQLWSMNQTWDTRGLPVYQLILTENATDWQSVDYTDCTIEADISNPAAVNETCNNQVVHYSYQAVSLDGYSVASVINQILQDELDAQVQIDEDLWPATFSEGDVGYQLSLTSVNSYLGLSCRIYDDNHSGDETCPLNYEGDDTTTTLEDMLGADYYCDTPSYIAGDAGDSTGSLIAKDTGLETGTWSIQEFATTRYMSFDCASSSNSDVLVEYNGRVTTASFTEGSEYLYAYDEGQYDYNASAAAKVDAIIEANFPVITYEPYQPPQYVYSPADFPAALSGGLVEYALDDHEQNGTEVAEAQRYLIDFNGSDQITSSEELLTDNDEWITVDDVGWEIRLIDDTWTVVDQSQCAASANADDANKLDVNCTGEASVITADVTDLSGTEIGVYIGYLAARRFAGDSSEFDAVQQALEDLTPQLFPENSQGYRLAVTRTIDLYELECGDDGNGNINWDDCDTRGEGTINDVIGSVRYQCESSYDINDDGHVYRYGEDIGEWQQETVGGYEALFFPLDACEFAPDHIQIGYISIDGVLIDISKTPAGMVLQEEGPALLNETASAALANMLEQLLPLTLEEYGYECSVDGENDADCDGYSDNEEWDSGTDPYDDESYPGNGHSGGTPVSQENRGDIQLLADIANMEVTQFNANNMFEDGFTSYWSTEEEGDLTFLRQTVMDTQASHEVWTGTEWRLIHSWMLTGNSVALTADGWRHSDEFESCSSGPADDDSMVYELSCPYGTFRWEAQGFPLVTPTTIAGFFINLLENGNYGYIYGSLTEEMLERIRDELNGKNETFFAGIAFKMTRTGDDIYVAQCSAHDENGIPTECSGAPFTTLADMTDTAFYSSACGFDITLLSSGEVELTSGEYAGRWSEVEPVTGYPVIEVASQFACAQERFGFAEINGNVVPVSIQETTSPEDIFFDNEASFSLDQLIMEHFPMSSTQDDTDAPTLDLPELSPANANNAFTEGLTELRIESDEDQSGFELERSLLQLSDNQLTGTNEYWDGSEWWTYTSYRAALVDGEWQSISTAPNCPVTPSGDNFTLSCEDFTEQIGVRSVSLEGIYIKNYLEVVAWDSLEGEGYSYDTFQATLDDIADALFSPVAEAYAIVGTYLSDEYSLDCDAEESGIDCSDADSYGEGTLEETLTSVFSECGDDFQFTPEGLLRNGNMLSTVAEYTITIGDTEIWALPEGVCSIPGERIGYTSHNGIIRMVDIILAGGTFESDPSFLNAAAMYDIQILVDQMN
ncbi:MopE-related protein [Thalassolituus sp.]|uniref:MopE-related protein n=2 Tax=Thalassolituus sp. TaxID=2030822 RepID=UPI0035182428